MTERELEYALGAGSLTAAERNMRMKSEAYEGLEMEILVFEAEDVITESPPVELPPVVRP